MAYCTQSDILNQISERSLTELTDDAGTGEIDGVVVERAIADADAAIDAYCQERYTVPLSPVPPMIRRISVDMAIYNLYTRQDTVEMPKIRSDRNQAALRFLEMVSQGKIALGAASPAPADTAHNADIAGNDRLFTRDKMSGF